MENKQRFPGFIGPSNVMRVTRFDAERTVNLYLEASPLGIGKGNEPMSLNSLPGLELLFTLGAGPIRAVYQVSADNAVYIVSGNQIWKMINTALTPTLIGTMLTSSGFVGVADNGIQVVFVDGFNGYYSTLADASPTITVINDPHFYPASTVTFQDGYFIFGQNSSIYFFLSDLYAVTFSPLNQSGKAGNSDILAGVVSNNRELYVFGQNTTEIWWDSGLSGSTPFTRQDGKFSQIGCLAPGSIARLFNTVMWLGSSPEGGAVVYQMQNDTAVRVSNHAIETSLQKVSVNLIFSTAKVKQSEGHYYYELDVIGLDTTWVYDLATSQWFERQSNINGVVGRHLAQGHAYFNGLHVSGDYTNGNVYADNFDLGTDNGQPITWTRRTPHSSQSLNRIFYKLLEVDFQPGTTDADPLTLRISNDGAKTFGNPIYASQGALGDYLARARWQILGQSRDRVFEVSGSAPVKLLSAMVDVEVGTN